MTQQDEIAKLLQSAREQVSALTKTADSVQKTMEQTREEQKRLQQLETKVQSSQNELSALQQQKLRLRQDIERVTARLLRERDESFVSQEKEARLAIAPLEKQRDDIKSQVTSLETRKFELGQEVIGAENKLNDLQNLFAQITKDNQDAAELSKRLETQYLSLKSENGALNQSISDGKQAILSTEEELITLKKQRNDLIAVNTDLEAKDNIEKEARKHELDVLNDKLKGIKNEILQNIGEQDLARRDIARRTQELDDKEQVLRRRELKVEQGENRIQQNASLLDL